MGMRKKKSGNTQLLVKSSAGTGLKHKARHHIDVVTNLPIPLPPPRLHYAIKRESSDVPFPTRTITNLGAVSTGMHSTKKMEVIHELLSSHHFSYVPLNKTVYTAAYSGCISGFVGSSRDLQDPNSPDYLGFAQIAGAFAKSFDIEWGDGTPDTLQVFSIELTCKAVWEDRNVNINVNSLNTASFITICQAIIAIVTESEAYFATQSIVPDPWPGGGGGSGTVTSVAAGLGISITGSPTIAPVVNNTGVLSVAAGSNVTITGTAQNPIINSTSAGAVAQVHAGTAISVTGTLADPIVNNTGVTSAIAGTGIGVSGPTGAVTFTNTDSGSGVVPVVVAPGFTQPLIGASVAIPLNSSIGVNGPGDFLTVEVLGVPNYYQINLILDDVTVMATNMGGNNVTPGTAIAAGSAVLPDAPALATVNGPDIGQSTTGTSVTQFVQGISGFLGAVQLPMGVTGFMWPQGGPIMWDVAQAQNQQIPQDTIFRSQQPGSAPVLSANGVVGNFVFDVGTPLGGNNYGQLRVVANNLVYAAIGPQPGGAGAGCLWLGQVNANEPDATNFAMYVGAGTTWINAVGGASPVTQMLFSGAIKSSWFANSLQLFGTCSPGNNNALFIEDSSTGINANSTGTTGSQWISTAGAMAAVGSGDSYIECGAAGPPTGTSNTQLLKVVRRLFALRTGATGVQPIGTAIVQAAASSLMRLQYKLTGKDLNSGIVSKFEDGVFWVQATGTVLAIVNGNATSTTLLGTPPQYSISTAASLPYVTLTFSTDNIQFNISPDNAHTTDWQLHIVGDWN